VPNDQLQLCPCTHGGLLLLRPRTCQSALRKVLFYVVSSRLMGQTVVVGGEHLLFESRDSAMEHGIWRHVTVRCSDVNSVRAAVVPVLEGNLDKLPTMPSRTVRVFLSSTFSGLFTVKFYLHLFRFVVDRLVSIQQIHNNRTTVHSNLTKWSLSLKLYHIP